MNTTKKTPGQVAYEAYHSARDGYKWEHSPLQAEFEAAATAVLADQWRSVAEPPEDVSDFVIVSAGTRQGDGICQFKLKSLSRTHWMPIPPLPPLPQPPVDPYADLKQAHAAGKVIQIQWTVDKGTDLWRDHAVPDWSLPTDHYRIKPWTLSRSLPGFRPLEDGEEWNPEDPNSPWVESDLPNGYRPALKGETGPFEGWYIGSKTWSETVSPEKAVPPNLKYRTTRPLPPTKEELEREEFEKVFQVQIQERSHTHNGYLDRNTQNQWLGWQAARATKKDYSHHITHASKQGISTLTP